MILHTAQNPAPNPRRVRIFLAEKGIEVPETRVQMMKGEHKSPEFLAKNSLGQVPTLELDDGTCIAESVAICRYFDEMQPDPPMFGTTPVEKAQSEMWLRRVELKVWKPVLDFWMYAHPRTAAVLPRYEDFGATSCENYRKAQKWVDDELKGRTWLAGDSYSMADVCLLTSVDFADWIGLPVDPALERLTAWRARATARPSASA